MTDLRHEQLICEHCRRRTPALTHREAEDEYWCDSCWDNASEDAYMRQQERDLESPPESSREAHLRTWNEHQQLHKR